LVGLVWTDDEGMLAMMYEAAVGGSSSKPQGESRLDMGGHITKPEDIRAPTNETIPVIDVPATPDPESLIDELPAEGEGTATRKPGKPEVGSAEVEIVDENNDWVIHTMVPMETVDQVAYRYAVRPDALRMWNGIKAETQELKKGARVKVKPRRIPPARRKYEYWVQPGDNWWSIGTTFGVDSRDLRAENWSTPQRLRVGQSIEMWIDPVVYLWVSSEGDPHTPTSVRRGAVGIGPPQSGRLVNGVQLPTHPAYHLKLPPSAYGTTHAVAHVVHAMDEFKKRSSYSRKLMMGSMSAKHGGPLAGHRSHQTGRDLDIRLPLLASVPEWSPVVPSRVDWEALWHLIESFSATGQVVVVFLDYDMQEHLYKAATAMDVTEVDRKRVLQWPRGNKAHLGLVRHSPGHAAHIHVRFACGPYETECIAESDYDEDD
ncbi:MAG TPA: penicillin-insensitive murein endopeptidase, partial [Nannocystaceae bacterium]|nr:penicillin-insensitive murein endopeptidase [Nannocystaceae bacterium]